MTEHSHFAGSAEALTGFTDVSCIACERKRSIQSLRTIQNGAMGAPSNPIVSIYAIFTYIWII